MKKIEKELAEFRSFKKKYVFSQKEIKDINGIKYCDGISLVDEEGKTIGESEKWINVGYKIKGAYSKVLSNLFPYQFVFKGKKMSSIECFFQGIKFKNIDMQNLVLNYSGLDSNNIKIASDYDWKKSGIVYWQGKAINRFDEEYDNLIDELYISALQNPLYRNVLKQCNKYILHEIGTLEKEETVFTRYEFEKQLNCLKDFLKKENT